MMQTTHQTYDVVVIGGGPVGENAADRAGRTGLSVVLVEAELVGGECSYWACMPSKTLLRPGAALAAARIVPGLAGPERIDAREVLSWRNRVVGDWDDTSQEEWLSGAGIDLVRGRARITAEREIDVLGADGGHRTLLARHAVIVATGSAPSMPDIPGLAELGPWGSREATGAREIPSSLAIVGGGVVAAEMATAYADLGARVTVLSRGPLLARNEPFAGEAVAAELAKSGVNVRTRVAVTRAERVDEGIRLHVSRLTGADESGSDESAEHAASHVIAERVLVATGRVPRTMDLGVESVGLVPGDPLDVDESLAVRGVSGGWLFAAGDVTGRCATTHQGKYEARVVGDVVARRFAPRGDAEAASTSQDAGRSGASGNSATRPGEQWTPLTATADRLAPTQAIFTRPEVAAVGLTEDAARSAGINVRTVRCALSSAAGATVMGSGYDGTAQIVVDADKEVIVGATFVGPDAAEMLHAATIAVVGEVPLGRLWHAVPAYPTVSEVWLRLLEGYGL